MRSERNGPKLTHCAAEWYNPGQAVQTESTCREKELITVKIAVMSDRADRTGTVPDTFEKSPVLLVVETDDGTIAGVSEGKTAEAFAEEIAASRWEAVVCGPHIGRECFEPIADACVTRYNGAGLPVLQAALAADRGRLPLIPDFEGGTGCGSGTGTCGECEHGDGG